MKIKKCIRALVWHLKAFFHPLPPLKGVRGTCVCACTHSHNSLLELHKASTSPEKTLNTEWGGRVMVAPSSNSPCGEAFQKQHTDPRHPNTFAWNHFIRNINFIKETGEPEKKDPWLAPFPPKKPHTTGSKENTNGCQFSFKFEKELGISLWERDCWNIYKFQELRSFSLMAFLIYIFVAHLKGRLFGILYPSNGCDQEEILKISSCSYFVKLNPEKAEHGPIHICM